MQMQMQRLAAAAALIVTIGPAGLAAQENDRNRPTVEFAAGSHLRDGGDSQSLSFGIPAGRYVNFLVSGERSHVPIRIDRFEDGFSADRGGTVKFVSAAVRVSPFPFARVSPYALAGLGRGTSRPNVSEVFPDPVPTRQVTLLFGGGGVRVPLVWRLSAFADARFVFWAGDGNDELGVIVPIRGGLAWRF